MKIIQNYLYNLMYQILIMVLPIITIPYVSRVLGPRGLGTYALTNAYAQYFILFGMLGLSIYSSREIAYVRDDNNKLSKTFWEINFLRLITLGISLILYLFACEFIFQQQFGFVSFLQTLSIIGSLVDISWLFIGLEDFKKVVIKSTLVKVLGALLVFSFVKDSSQVWLYTLILGSTLLFGQMTMWLEIPKNIYFVFPNRKSMIKHLKFSISLFIPQIAINVYTMLDKVMLGAFINDSQVGMYDNTQKLISLLVTIVTTLATVTTPKMANLYKNMQYEEFNEYVYKSFSFVSFFSFPMTFGLVAISSLIVPWFYGQQFKEIIPMLHVGSFLMITLGWSSILGNQILISIKREKYFTISVSCGAIMNIIFNFLLIKKFEGLGTTISSVIAEYTGMFLMLFFVKDIINIQRLFKPVGKYIVVSLVMYSLIWLISKNLSASIINSILIVLLGGAFYITIMVLTKDDNLMYVFYFIKSKLMKSKVITQK